MAEPGIKPDPSLRCCIATLLFRSENSIKVHTVFRNIVSEILLFQKVFWRSYNIVPFKFIIRFYSELIVIISWKITDFWTVPLHSGPTMFPVLNINRGIIFYLVILVKSIFIYIFKKIYSQRNATSTTLINPLKSNAFFISFIHFNIFIDNYTLNVQGVPENMRFTNFFSSCMRHYA